MDEVPKSKRYEIIYLTISNDNNQLNISTLCEIAQVSRSGFYDWLNRKEDDNNSRELKDKADFDLILQAFKFRGYDKGSRGIHMRLLHMGITMNRKKIQRLMRKYHLFCPIRKPNPYKQMMKAIQTSTVADNILERNFRKYGPRYVLLTDITYLFYGRQKKAYLSSIKDSYTKEILEYSLSENM